MKKEKKLVESSEVPVVPATPASSKRDEEVWVYVLDRAVFLQIEGVPLLRAEADRGQRDPPRRVAVWVFQKNERVDSLLAEIINPTRTEVRYLRKFLDQAMTDRVLKRSLERSA